MSKPGSVLIVGATGYIGQHIARACLKFEHPTFLLVRPDVVSDMRKAQLIKSLKGSGATLVQGTIEDVSSLLAAVKQVDFVISCIAEDKILEQLKLVEAMEQAGNIKRFLPSEFGMDPDRLLDCPKLVGDLFTAKRAVRRAVEKAGIPYTYVSANCLSGYFLAGLAQINQFWPPTDHVIIYGDGNQKVIWNREEDVASYVVKSIEDPRTLNTTIYIRPPANILSLNEVVDIWEEQSGQVLQKIHVPECTWLNETEDCPEMWRKIVMGHFHLIFYRGVLYNFDVEANKEASQLYPEISFTTVKSYLQDFL